MEEIARESLEAMRRVPCEDGDIWYVYENRDLGSSQRGHLQFLLVGPARTYREPPPRMPDTQAGLGWRYLLVGTVDLATGTVTEIKPDSPALADAECGFVKDFED